MSIKQFVFDVIQPDDGDSFLSRLFDRMITVLILISVATVFAVTFDLPENVLGILEIVEATASIVFTVEYLLRIWTADKLYPKMSSVKARIRFVFSIMAIIDLLAIMPFWLPKVFPGSLLGMRALRLIRLLRILKLNRYFNAVKSIGDVIASKKNELVGSAFFVFLLMMVSSLLMYAVEHDAQPHVFKNAFSGLWWAIATLTTVGYGDIYPITVPGRILGAVIALSGVAALAIPTGIITSGLMERVGKHDIAKEARVRSSKDIEHDQELFEQRKMLDALDAKLNKLLEMESKNDHEV